MDADTFAQEIGQRVRAGRTQRGLTQMELARELGYRSSVSVSRFERGTAEVPAAMIVPMARALGIPVLHLLGLDEDLPAMDMDSRLAQLQRQNEELRAGMDRLARQLADGPCGAVDEPAEDDRCARTLLENEALRKRVRELETSADRADHGECGDPACQLKLSHTGLHYDGTRRYVSARREGS